MVCLAWTVKDAQMEEKHCYHCSSSEHFICDCPMVKATRESVQLNHVEGMALKKECWAPQVRQSMPRDPQEEAPRA